MTKRTTAQTGSVLNIALILGLLVMVAIGVVGVLWATEKVELPALDRLLGREKKVENVLDGRIPVPMSTRYIHAYEKVIKDDIWDLKEGGIKFIYLDPDKIGENVVTKASAILNRVMARDKEPGYIFSESDFLPRGTRAGMTAGIPPGMVSQRVSADRIKGLHGLNPRDKFFLLATYPIESDDEDDLSDLGLIGAAGRKLVMDAKERKRRTQNARVELIVQDGYVVSGVQARMSTKTVNTLTSGKVTRNSPVQEIVIAISLDEVWKLNEALALEAEITCCGRSAHPEDPGTLPVPNFGSDQQGEQSGLMSEIFGASAAGGGKSDGSGAFRLLDTISGSERSTKAVPTKSKKSDKMRLEIDPSHQK